MWLHTADGVVEQIRSARPHPSAPSWHQLQALQDQRRRKATLGASSGRPPVYGGGRLETWARSLRICKICGRDRRRNLLLKGHRRLRHRFRIWASRQGRASLGELNPRTPSSAPRHARSIQAKAIVDRSVFSRHIVGPSQSSQNPRISSR